MLDRLIWHWRYFWQAKRATWHLRYLKRVLPIHIDRILKTYGQVIPDTDNELGNRVRAHILATWGDLQIKYDPLLHDVSVWDTRFEISILASYDLTDNSLIRWNKLIVGEWCNDLIQWGEELYLESEKPKRLSQANKSDLTLDDLLDEQNDEQQYK